MFRIQKPLPFPELETKPEIAGMPNLTEDMQQGLSLLSGFDGSFRHLLSCSEGGILRTTSPRSLKTRLQTASGDGETWNPTSAICSECLVRAAPANSGNVYVQMDETATAALAWPLDANECVKVHPENINNINILFETSGDKVYLFPTK